ncbi:aminoglycoside phosphotransferase family protein [Streptomyces parvulus]|uniref:Aminoglycoside phosphotransferase family protein n=1 Tax=Streptomyces parvulus TaxID=146923 RepID=A0A369V486_9ACTN|nr:aminoglycoside phosphotransferase family protein [Streptomyces parvulus]
MSAHVCPCPRCPRPADALAREFRDRALREGVPMGGHHNRNHLSALPPAMACELGRAPGESVIVRVQKAGVLLVTVRTWRPPQEGHLLHAVREAVPGAPECLAQYDDFAVHSCVEGTPLAFRSEDGKPVDHWAIKALAEILARIHGVKAGELPPLPRGWPVTGDSRGFLRALAQAADEQIVRPNWAEFRDLFGALGVTQNAMKRLEERVPRMASRPFGMLHGDLHRDNVLETDSPAALLLPVDLELATYGDPLHDLATHLVRMKYPEHQWGEVIAAWHEAMSARCPDAITGLDSDLRHYVDFERAQSVFPDVMRAARSLWGAADGGAMAAAADRVHRAVETASEALGLRRVPGPGEVEAVLDGWLSTRRPGVAGARGRSGGRPPRVTGRPRRAPRAESPAGCYEPVAPRRRERAFLGEHALLRAIEDLRDQVADQLLMPYADGVRHLGRVGAGLSRRVLRRVAAAWRACVARLGRLAAGVRLAVRNVRQAARVAWEVGRQGGGRGLGVVGA